MKVSRDWLRREPAIVASLFALSTALFILTYLVTTAFHHEQASLAERFFAAGQQALASAQPGSAIEDFQTALLYKPGNDDYRFHLAKSLASAGRNKEALSHFMNLWEREPGNGEVNLELARLSARMGEPNQALRFFHGAVYGVWPDRPDQYRREARLELAEYLLNQRSFEQAETELMALAADMPDDATLWVKVGALFLEAKDPAHALEQFNSALVRDASNREALIGGAHAAFDLGQYWTAASYLIRAGATETLDQDSQNVLQLSQLVLTIDPFRRGISSRERASRVAAAFETAGRRLQECIASKNLNAAGGGDAANGSLLQRDYARWRALQPTAKVRDFVRQPDSIDSVMNLVFQIEADTQSECGSPSGRDLALLLISKTRSGGEK